MYWSLAGGTDGIAAPSLAIMLACTVAAPAQQLPSKEDLQEIWSIESAKALEAQVQRAHAIALPASVGIEVMSESAGSSGSGTIISKDGWILTAGHVTAQPDLPVIIHLASGVTVEGKSSGLRWNDAEDCGLVRFDPTGLDFAVAQLGDAREVHPGDWVIAMGHTYGIEKEPFRPPVLRLGRVRMADGNLVHFDAPLSSGDSGGGVFDLTGKLIGVNSTTGPELDTNTATSIALVGAFLSDMQQGAATGNHADKARGQQGDDEPSVPIELHSPPKDAPRKDGPDSHEALSGAVDAASLMTVGIYINGKQVGLGTVAAEDGYIVAKASDVGDATECVLVALPDGLSVCGERMAVDEERDLVLIKTQETLEAPAFAVDSNPPVGAILLSVGRDAKPAAIGVRSLGEYKPGRSDVTAPYLGIRVRPATAEESAQHEDRQGVILTTLAPGAPAGRAGLSVGDFIVRVAGCAVENQRQLGEAIRKHASGEVIEVVRLGDGGEESVRARLSPRPLRSGASPSTPMFPASRRTSGFGTVIQHDGAVRADEVGGPLVDLDGRVVGMNIARGDRTKTYALPASVLKGAIDRMIESARARTGPLPVIDPLATGIPVRQDGPTTRLDAVCGEIRGETMQLMQMDDVPGFVGNWVDPNESVRWVVEFTQPGDYAVRVLQACPTECAGQDFQVTVGGTVLRSKSRPTADFLDFQPYDLGSFHVEQPGRAIVEIGTGGALKCPLMNLHAIELKRTS